LVQAARDAVAAHGDITAMQHAAQWLDAHTMKFRPAPGGRKCVSGCVHDGTNAFLVRVNAARQLMYKCYSENCPNEYMYIGQAPAGAHQWNVKADAVVHPRLDALGRPSVPDTPLPEGKKHLVEQAPTGTGKSKRNAARVRSAICAATAKGEEGPSVLVVAPLRSLTQYLHEKLYPPALGFRYYMDENTVQGDGEIRDNRLVICCNSLWRVARHRFDIVVVEEPNKTLRSLATMEPKSRPYENYCVQLRRFVHDANQVYLADAYADSLVNTCLEHAGVAASAHWVRIDYTPHPHRRVEMLFSDSKQAYLDRLVEAVCRGKRIAVYCSLQKDAAEMCDGLTKAMPDVHALVLSSDTPDKEDKLRRLLRAPPDVLFYTSCLSVGYSIEVAHFHMVFAVLDLHGPRDAETVMQSIARPRCLLHDAAECAEPSIVICFPPGIHDEEVGCSSWESTRVDAVDPAHLLEGFATKKAALAAVRATPSTYPNKEYYIALPQTKRQHEEGEPGAMYRLRRRPPPRLINESIAEEAVLAAIARNVAKSQKSDDWVPESYVAWTDEGMALLDLNETPFLREARPLLDLRVAVYMEAANFPTTIVCDLERMLKMDGATVSKMFVTTDEAGAGDEETDPADPAMPRLADIRRERRDAHKRARVEAEVLDAVAQRELCRALKRQRCRTPQQHAAIERLYVEKTFGPQLDEDGQQRYLLKKQNVQTLYSREVQTRFRLQCRLSPCADDPRSFGERVASLCAAGVGLPSEHVRPGDHRERVLDSKACQFQKALAGRDLLRSVGLEPSELSSEGLAAVGYDGLPRITEETVRLLNMITRGAPVNDGNKLSRFVSAIKKTLGLRVCNPDGTRFKTDRDNDTRLRFEPGLPTPEHSLYVEHCKWRATMSHLET
jgi:hypothetical protein